MSHFRLTGSCKSPCVFQRHKVRRLTWKGRHLVHCGKTVASSDRTPNSRIANLREGFLLIFVFPKLRMFLGSAKKCRLEAMSSTCDIKGPLPATRPPWPHLQPWRGEQWNVTQALTKVVSHHLSLHYRSHAAQKEHLVQIIYIALDMQLCRRWKKACLFNKKKITIIDGRRMREGGEASLCDFSPFAERHFILKIYHFSPSAAVQILGGRKGGWVGSVKWHCAKKKSAAAASSHLPKKKKKKNPDYQPNCSTSSDPPIVGSAGVSSRLLRHIADLTLRILPNSSSSWGNEPRNGGGGVLDAEQSQQLESRPELSAPLRCYNLLLW